MTGGPAPLADPLAGGADRLLQKLLPQTFDATADGSQTFSAGQSDQSDEP